MTQCVVTQCSLWEHNTAWLKCFWTPFQSGPDSDPKKAMLGVGRPLHCAPSHFPLPLAVSSDIVRVHYYHDVCITLILCFSLFIVDMYWLHVCYKWNIPSLAQEQCKHDIYHVSIYNKKGCPCKTTTNHCARYNTFFFSLLFVVFVAKCGKKKRCIPLNGE